MKDWLNMCVLIYDEFRFMYMSDSLSKPLASSYFLLNPFNINTGGIN